MPKKHGIFTILSDFLKNITMLEYMPKKTQAYIPWNVFDQAGIYGQETWHIHSLMLFLN